MGKRYFASSFTHLGNNFAHIHTVVWSSSAYLLLVRQEPVDDEQLVWPHHLDHLADPRVCMPGRASPSNGQGFTHQVFSQRPAQDVRHHCHTRHPLRIRRPFGRILGLSHVTSWLSTVTLDQPMPLNNNIIINTNNLNISRCKQIFMVWLRKAVTSRSWSAVLFSQYVCDTYHEGKIDLVLCWTWIFCRGSPGQVQIAYHF